MDTTSSTITAEFMIPEYSSIFSVKKRNIGIEMDSLPFATMFGSGVDYAANHVPFDGDLSSPFVSDTQDCEIGFSFQEYKIGYLSELRYYLPHIVDRSAIIG